MYLISCFRFLLVSSLLLTGQFPISSTLFFRITVAFFSLLQWNIRWSAVCVQYLYTYCALFAVFPDFCVSKIGCSLGPRVLLGLGINVNLAWVLLIIEQNQVSYRRHGWHFASIKFLFAVRLTHVVSR